MLMALVCSFTYLESLCCTHGANVLNTVYFRRGLTCTLGLTNDLIDGGQPRAKNGFLKRDLTSLYVDGVSIKSLVTQEYTLDLV